MNVIGKSPRIKTVGDDPPIGASPKSRTSTPGKSPGKFSPYQSITGAGTQDQYQFQAESPSYSITEAERYYRKVVYVLEKKKPLSDLRIQHKDGKVTITRISRISDHTINFTIPATWQLMRNLYMLFALCDDEDVLSNLLQQNFPDYSGEDSPNLQALSRSW